MPLLKDFMWFCNAVVRWQNPSPVLNEMFAKVYICHELVEGGLKHFTQILQAFSQMAGPQWENQMLSYGPTIADRLRARYNV
jgi:transportin-1